MAERGISIFNLERTITDHVEIEVYQSILQAGLELPSSNTNFDSLSPAEQRRVLQGWFANKTEDDIEPVLDNIAVRASKKLALWSALVIQAEADLGNQLCIYSATHPDEIVGVYADGVEQAIPGIEIDWHFGKPMVLEDGAYTGESGRMKKGEVVQKLVDDGAAITFIADSFAKAIPAIRLARRALIVNPDAPEHLHKNFPDARQLYWTVRRDHEARLKIPGETNDRKYDLMDVEDQQRLLADLGYYQ